MLRFVLQRLALIVLVLTTVIFVVYLGMALVERNARFEAPETIWDLSKTSLADTRDFYGNALRGEFGVYHTGNPLVEPAPVNIMLRDAFSNSMGLMGIASAISIVVGLLLGIFVALTRIKGVPFAVLTSTIVAISVPSFFAALLLQNFIIGIFAEYGRRYLSVAGMGWDYQHLTMPVLVLLARPVAYIMRTSYIVLERTMQEDYIRTAYSKGLSQRYVVNIHALRNVAVPILTAIGVSWRFSLGILPVVELMFGWQGMGYRMLEGINSVQTVMVVPLAAIFCLLLLFFNFVLDVGYRFIDPRLREEL